MSLKDYLRDKSVEEKIIRTRFSLKSTFYCSLWQAFAVGQSTRISRVSRLGLEMLRLLVEDSESDSDSIFQYTQSRTRNRNRSSKALKKRKLQYLWLFEGKKRKIGLEIPRLSVQDSESVSESESLLHNAGSRTRNRTRNSDL